MNGVAFPAARPAGAIRLGSEEHLRLFCLELLETHDPYKPAVIAWPTLDDETRHRVTSLPIWDIAVQTEGRAGMNVKTFAERGCTGLLREAIELNAFEESRHKEVLANMVAFYGIELQPEPEYEVPRDAEWAFMVTGYSECIDSSASGRTGEILRLLSAGARGNVRAGDARGRPPHPVLRQLGCLVAP